MIPTQSLLLQLLDETLLIYHNDKIVTERVAIIFTVLAVLTGSAIAIFMQLYFLRSFLDKELQRKRMLDIIPLNMLVDNKILK